MKTEKNIVIRDGKPKEIRFYEDDKLTARLGIILGADDNFIGLRELEVEKVAPPSWLDRNFRRRKHKPSPITITTIDFIGLINWIDTINRIKTINTIENIDKIGEISTIRDLLYAPPSFWVNPFFSQGFIGWNKIGTVNIEGVGSGEGEYLSFTNLVNGELRQDLPIALGVDWYSEFYCWVRSATTGVTILNVRVFYTDETNTVQNLSVAIDDFWTKKTLNFSAGKHIREINIRHFNSYPQSDFGWLTLVF